jgi:hypothetical protein
MFIGKAQLRGPETNEEVRTFIETGADVGSRPPESPQNRGSL